MKPPNISLKYQKLLNIKHNIHINDIFVISIYFQKGPLLPSNVQEYP